MTITSVQPYLSVRNAEEAIRFYKQAFGAEDGAHLLQAPDGQVVHADIRIGDTTLMLADESPEFGNISPTSLGGTAVRIHLETDDVDTLAARAIDAGAKLLISVDDQFYGYRAGRIEDPFGHIWILSQKLEDLSTEQMQNRLNALYEQGP